MSDCTPIKNLLNWNEESPIFNLFPFNDQDLIKNLKDIFYNNIYEQLPNQINQFYDDLQAKIVQMIAESKKKSIMLAQQLSEQKQKALKYYKQVVSVGEIQKILQSQNFNQDQIQKFYKDHLKMIYESQERNTKVIKDLNSEQQQTYSQLKLVQQQLISSSLLSIKSDDEFLKKFPLILPNQIDLMSFLEFRKVDKATNMVSQENILKMVNNKFQFKQFDQRQQGYQENNFYESNLVLDQSKLYIFRFQILDMSPQKILILLSNKIQPLDNNQIGKISKKSQNVQENIFSSNLNKCFLLYIQGNGNNQFQFVNVNNNNSQGLFGGNSMNTQNQFQITNGNLNQSLNIETLFEIKIQISKGKFEVYDYPNKQIVATLTQNYQNQLQSSQNEQFTICFNGNLALQYAAELEQEI
ncbi:hypothetical protein ABPG74_007691 [Tetrahymena malaccensis]